MALKEFKRFKIRGRFEWLRRCEQLAATDAAQPAEAQSPGCAFPGTQSAGCGSLPAQSSSASRVTAGAAGFLILSQCGERPALDLDQCGSSIKSDSVFEGAVRGPFPVSSKLKGRSNCGLFVLAPPILLGLARGARQREATFRHCGHIDIGQRQVFPFL